MLGTIAFGIFGLAVLVSIAFVFSGNRRATDLRLIVTGIRQGTVRSPVGYLAALIATDQELYELVLFQNAKYVTLSAPNFRSFLQYYLPSTIPTNVDDFVSSACNETAEPPASPGRRRAS